MAAKKRKQKVTITVDAKHRHKIKDVAHRLRKAGLSLTDEGTLEAIGVIQGSCDEEHLENIRKVQGVQELADSHKVQLPPPDSDIQ